MSTRENTAQGFNANTVLLTILLAISGWSLITLIDVKDTLTKTVVRVDYLTASDAEHARILADIQARRNYTSNSPALSQPPKS